MNLLNRILLAAAISWISSVTLGLLFAAGTSGHFSLRTLGLPGVVPVALIVSTVVSVALTPLLVWALKTGTRNLYVYGPIFWIALATYDAAVVPRTGAYGLWSLLFLGLASVAGLRLIPAK
jgi:hypothetical protein